MVTPIILTVIGVAASVITLFLLIIKFVKEPLDQRIDGVDQRMDRVETNLSTQIDGVDKKVDKLYEILLTHYMDKDKEQ
jgi:hypothetical protein